MQKYFEKIKEGLEERSLGGMGCPQWVPLESAIETVNQVAEEYSTNSTDINKIFDILDQFHMFQGQRAGRELWGNKPKAVQDRDIANFNRNLQTIRNYIKENLNKTDGWIPCSEKTPEFEIYAIKRMWVTMHKKGCGFHFSRQLRWNGRMGRWEWENGKTVSDGYEIVAWKPVDIPEPYQPKGE